LCKLIVAFEAVEAWHVTQHPNYEAAVLARDKILTAQRRAELNERAGHKSSRPRKVVKWTAVTSEK
jgi:hypothetical protein